jgi:hypothetical protein
VEGGREALEEGRWGEFAGRREGEGVKARGEEGSKGLVAGRAVAVGAEWAQGMHRERGGTGGLAGVRGGEGVGRRSRGGIAVLPRPRVEWRGRGREGGSEGGREGRGGEGDGVQGQGGGFRDIAGSNTALVALIEMGGVEERA